MILTRRISGWPWRHTITARQDFIDASGYSSRPDPSWSFTDEAGHVHTHATRGTTWTVEPDPYWCADCHDEHDFGRSICVHCRERITPGYVTEWKQEMIPGLVEISATLHVAPDDPPPPRTLPLPGAPRDLQWLSTAYVDGGFVVEYG